MGLLKVGFMGTKQLSYVSLNFSKTYCFVFFFTKIQIKHFRWTVEPIQFVHNKVKWIHVGPDQNIRVRIAAANI